MSGIAALHSCGRHHGSVSAYGWVAEKRESRPVVSEALHRKEALGSGFLRLRRSILADLQSPPYGLVGSIGVTFREVVFWKRGSFTLKFRTDLLDPKQVVLATNRTDASNPWAIRNPLDEARDLYRMVRFGSCATADIRELIAVPKHVREALLAYADRYPEDSERIRCILQFRERVAEEFERLIESDRSPAESGQTSADLPIYSGAAG